MITLELYKRDYNTKYLQYDPKKWVVGTRHEEGGINIEGYSIETGKMDRSWGYFNGTSIRTSSIPDYVSKSDIDTWN
jgi:hypothetical protein